MFKSNQLVTLKSLFFISITISSGCANNPKFITQKYYDPPTTDEAKNCVFQVETAKIACERDASVRSTSCLQQARINAEKPYQIAVMQYERKMEEIAIRREENKNQAEKASKAEWEQYNQCLQNQRMYASQGLAMQCNRPNPWIQGLSTAVGSLALDDPKKPTPEDYIDTRQCDKLENLCIKEYDLFYKQCGGEITQVTECIENCDKLPPQQRRVVNQY